MTVIQWAQPALLWDKTQPIEQRKKPQLLQLTSDDFLPEFLDAMNAEPKKELGSNPVALDFLNTKKMADSAAPLKLYQPLHSRYYLVTASLVCQQVGLPDKDVDLKKGEKTYFVIRRTQGGVEQGWSDSDGWFNIPEKPDPKSKSTPKEEHLPAHPVSVCTGEENNLVSCKRKIYYGYIPTGNREKYLDKQVVSTSTANSPEEKIKQFFASTTSQIDYRFDLFDTKVIATWTVLNRSVPAPANAIDTGSATILLEFVVFLKQALNAVWTALGNGDTTPLKPDELALYQFLNTNYINGGLISLRAALVAIAPNVGLLDRQDTIITPALGYNVTSFTDFQGLKVAVKAALGANPSSTVFANAADAEETANLIEKQIRPIPKDGKDIPYFLRMIYDYDPECPPIPSDPSSYFTIARNLEPDAPARMVRIEMPSIKPADLRKFRHGVGMQLSPELNKVMSGVNEGMLDKKGLGPTDGLSLDMICTFSIQIITLIAFVVMFIFAIALNIIFWWLAFLKICLPIPKSP